MLFEPEKHSKEPNEDGVWIIPAFKQEQAVVGGTGEISIEAVGVTTGIEGHEVTEVTGIAEAVMARPEDEVQKIRRFKITGSVPIENYGELFRCFVSPILPVWILRNSA